MTKTNSTRYTSGRLSKTPAYGSWYQMIRRCTVPEDSGYSNYGARGITVCERWFEFANFLEDMGQRPPGMSIDRIDTYQGYFPGNCRWATQAQQAVNTRANRHVVLNGEDSVLSELARKVGMTESLLRHRLKAGKTPEIAVSTPVRGHGKVKFHGKMMTLSQIAEELGFHRSALSSAVHKKIIDVTGAAKYYAKRRPRGTVNKAGVTIAELAEIVKRPPTKWEVDLAHPDNTPRSVMARNPVHYTRKARQWTLKSLMYLVKRGVLPQFLGGRGIPLRSA